METTHENQSRRLDKKSIWKRYNTPSKILYKNIKIGEIKIKEKKVLMMRTYRYIQEEKSLLNEHKIWNK